MLTHDDTLTSPLSAAMQLSLDIDTATLPKVLYKNTILMRINLHTFDKYKTSSICYQQILIIPRQV